MGAWWDGAVCYQIYPRSFADSNGDGIGDLPGITAHLDHLAWLGIDAVWLSPTFPSPNADWGYDVADYLGVHPELGTQDDLDALLAAARERGIAVLLDLVPNHTSTAHAWFEDSRSSRTAAHRDWYVWADPRSGGGPPNNWVSSFFGPAWTLDERTGQMYLHNFLPEQADLDWWNDDVRGEFDRILRHWFDRGVAGFRIDVAHMIVKDRDLRDNPPAGPDDSVLAQLRGQVARYNSNRPEVHDVHRRWRCLADGYDPPRLLVGETFVDRLEDVIPFYGAGDELGLAFNIPFLQAPFDAATLAELVARTERLLPEACSPVWTGSNHDVSRLPTRWAAGSPAMTRCALMMLLTLRGTAFLYYGDELGMPDTDVPRERLLDPVSIRFAPVHNRDAARTPMPWHGGAGAGFTAPGVEPWLPFGDIARCNVADQRDDPSSTLHLVRDLVALRRELDDLRTGAYAPLASDDTLWAWRRGTSVVVAFNLADDAATLDDVQGTIRVCTDRARDGERVDGALRLGPREGAVTLLQPSM
ncbi:MAG TPA: alpha-amylase family glycosyl hydrolase [Acidimicrobiia bacterium]|jgi:alpha-glucosidase